MNKSALRKVARALETGGLSLIFEKGETPPPVERREPTTRFERFTQVLATGGYSLIEKHVEVEDNHSEAGQDKSKSLQE